MRKVVHSQCSGSAMLSRSFHVSILKVLLVISWSQGGCPGSRHHIFVPGRRKGIMTSSICLFYDLPVLIAKQKLPQKSSSHFFLCLFGEKWIMWLLLVARKSREASLWLISHKGSCLRVCICPICLQYYILSILLVISSLVGFCYSLISPVPLFYFKT